MLLRRLGRPRPRVTVVGVLASFACLASLSLAAEPDVSEPAAALGLSRGAGVNVAVVSTGGGLADQVRAHAPGARVVRIPLELRAGSTRARAARPDERAQDRADERAQDRADDRAIARAIDRAVADGARVVLVGVTRRDEGERTTEAIRRAIEAGALVAAPAGDEGLSHERSPAATEGVIGVAALSSTRCLSDTTNAGARTTVAARGGSSFEAAAAVAAASALAFAFDPELNALELRRALEAGERVTRVSARGAAPSRLDLAELLDRVRPRSRAAVIRDVRVVPRHVPRGETARVRASVTAIGRLATRGPLVVHVEGLREVAIPFGPLAPGRTVELEAEMLPRVVGEPSVQRTADEGLLAVAPIVAIVRAQGTSLSATLDIVGAGERPPCLEIVSIAAADRLVVRVRVENASAAVEANAVVRLVGPGGSVLAEADAGTLAPGERPWVELAGRVESERAVEALRVQVEVVRRPPGMRETVHARCPLVLDARGAPPPRRSSRR